MDELKNNIILNIENINIGYKSSPIISNISAEICRGSLITLIGPNGAGKSTLIKTITRELNTISGEIYLFEKSLNSYSNKEFSRKCAIVTTEHINAGGLRVEQLVALGRHPFTGITGRLSLHDKEIINKAMSDVNIYYKKDDFIAYLSDGERQRVLIAKALAQEAPLLILDEPLSFLDVSSRIEIYSLLRKMAEEKNIGILLSCHDVAQALRMSNEIWMINANKEFISGSPQHLIETNALDLMFNSKTAVFNENLMDFVIADK